MATGIPQSLIVDSFLIMEHQEANAVSGGNMTASTWNIRKLNTVIMNTIDDALTNTSTFEFTLPKGTYLIDAYSQGYKCGTHQMRIQNLTDTTTTFVGSKVHSSTSHAVANDSIVMSKVLTLTDTKTFQMQHWSVQTNNTNGMGYGLNATDDIGVFGGITVRKIG